MFVCFLARFPSSFDASPRTQRGEALSTTRTNFLVPGIYRYPQARDTMTKDSKDEDSKKHVLRVAVGSTNPCKVDAVKQALERALETSTELTVEVEVEGFSVESGVPDQPFGDVSHFRLLLLLLLLFLLL